MTVNLKCAKCGSDKFEVQARPNDKSKITCGKAALSRLTER